MAAHFCFGHRRLTRKQAACLLAFDDYYRQHRRRPTLRDVANAVGLKTIAAVRPAVWSLMDRDYLEQLDVGKRRTIGLTEKGRAWCQAKRRRAWNKSRRDKKAAVKLRNYWIYEQVKRGTPWRRILDLMERSPKSWPRISTYDSVRACVKAHALANGLPVVSERKRRTV